MRFGVPREHVVTVSAHSVVRDRTFHSALAVKGWLTGQGLPVNAIDVVTMGPHARRSRLLFQSAFAADARIGIIALDDHRYDASHWWRSSEGVRTVLGEAIAYLYALTFSLLH